jgi:Xaa-Pro aminopeptidase
LAALTPGDLVVHQDHGIGRYDGLISIPVGNSPHDCVALTYAGGDKLYVPVENIDVLSRYGSDSENVALDKLGGEAWQRRKSRLKERIRAIAGELLKTAAELDNIRQATAISAQAHNRAREFTKVGHYEYQIQAEIEHTFRLEGGMGPAYPSIVASGANACILHYINNNRQVQENELLLIDAGCAYNYYNGDITRTFPVNGKFTPEQKIIYEIVLEAQLKAIEVVKTGNPYNLFHDTAVRTIVEGLVDLGLLVGDIDEIIKEEKYKPFYMHRTGHWLGLDVHDAGGYKVNEETWQTLQPGHVLTVEPGIYIAPDIKPAEGQPEVPEKWRGIGIRIEDDVLVTATGNEVLTATVPKKVEDIESK